MKKPSESLRPGPLRFLAKMSLDPATIIFTIVVGLAQGIARAVIEWREKKKKSKPKK